VQEQHRRGPRRLGPDQERRHTTGVHRPDLDLGRRRELGVQVLGGVPQGLQVDLVAGQLVDRLPDPGKAGRHLAADRPRGGHRVVDAVQEAARSVEQGLAGERQLDAVRGPPQQVAADVPLQAADLPAQGRLRQVQAGGGATEVQLLGDRHERAEVAQLDAVGRGR
jgi:hypothetical protein